jgi:hypothetical protein
MLVFVVKEETMSNFHVRLFLESLAVLYLLGEDWTTEKQIGEGQVSENRDEPRKERLLT